MSARLASDLAMSEIAGLCRLSLCHFVRAFGNTVGIAPYRWLVNERVAHAKILLIQTRLPLAEIALECGFSDQSHFTNTFVRHVGISPGRWQRAIRKWFRVGDGQAMRLGSKYSGRGHRAPDREDDFHDACF